MVRNIMKQIPVLFSKYEWLLESLQLSKMAELTNCRVSRRSFFFPFVYFFIKIRCRAHSEQAPFEEEDDGKKLPRCCCPLMTAHEQSEDKIPAQKVQGFKS
ncbi:hypothetical protein TNCT_446221 [Trichonephila clavata]|uniref:Uncharacterized protein n=1 Tax=Trichonephila clavata TaxID=2740835 RepID=A0A8X6G5L6_TRICU|nr:hypothetical protein TNCT_446221 [Trichonephila clavata]